MAVVGGHAEGAQPEGATEKRLGPSGARTSRGGEPFGHGAAPCAISHRPMAASRNSAHGVSGFQNDLVRSTSARWPSGELELDVAPAGHEEAVPVGLRDPDAVPGTGTPWTAVVPPACLHCAKLPPAPHGCHAAVERALGVARSCLLDHGRSPAPARRSGALDQIQVIYSGCPRISRFSAKSSQQHALT